MAGWEQADDATLAKNVNMIATSGPTTSTHIGQIVVLRKEQGSLGPRKR